MSITVPEKNWFRPAEGAERLWVGLALVWCIVMFVVMSFWHIKGKQNSTGEAYSVEPQRFSERVDLFVVRAGFGEVVGHGAWC